MYCEGIENKHFFIGLFLLVISVIRFSIANQFGMIQTENSLKVYQIGHRINKKTSELVSLDRRVVDKTSSRNHS